MKYTGLVDAINQDDEAEINRLLKSLIPQLIVYLKTQLNAQQQDAEDCAQQAFIASLEAIQNKDLDQPDRIFPFLITTCRNTYLNMMNRDKRTTHDDFSKEQNKQPGQLMSMLSDERRKLLKQCLEQLSEGYRTYIDYWFAHPDSDAKAAATHFDISEGNAWTRKHRVIGKLNDCYQKKF